MRRLIATSILLIATYLAAHEIIYDGHFWLRTRHDSSAVYVIGDSRTYHAVDVTELRRRTGRPFFSFAQPAMSAYSVLKFAEMVPRGATVLLGPSWGMLLRGGSASSFRSGFSLRGAFHLLRGERFDDLRRVFAANRIPVEAPFFRDTPPLPDSPVRDLGKLDKVRSYYLAPRPPDLELKHRLLEEAIDILVRKGCRIEVVEVPIPDDVAVVREATYGSVLLQLDGLHRPGIRIHSDLGLDTATGDLWFDADHMNARGRSKLTTFLVDRVFGPDRRSLPARSLRLDDRQLAPRHRDP